MTNKIIILSLIIFMIMYPIEVFGAISTSSGSAITSIATTTISNGQNITWDLDGTVTIKGTVTVKSGGKLTLAGTGIINRNSSFTDVLFKCEAGGTLIIKGDSLHSIVIDGKEVVQLNPAIICLGDVNVENVNIKNFSSDKTDYSVFSLNSETTGEVEIKNCLIEQCKTPSGAAMYLQDDGNARIYVYRTIFQNNETTKNSGGGCIGTEGTGKWQMTIEESVFRNNYGGRLGGAIRWNANGDGCSLIIKDSQFLNNWVGGTTSADGKNVEVANGGALFYEGNTGSIIGTEGTITKALDSATDLIPEAGIVGTLFQGNEVKKSVVREGKKNYAGTGGAICISSYGASSGVGDGRKCELALDGNILIQNNKVTNGGGGISLNVTNSAYLGENYPFSLTIGEGVCIKNNKIIWENIINSGDENDKYAKGGGIFINNEPEAKMLATVTIAGGVVQGNTTMGGTKGGKGGNIYVRNGTFIMNSGVVAGDGDTITAIDGGAVYVNEGDVTFNGGSISDAVVSGNGGGLYLTKGNFTMSGGNIGSVSANKKLGCKAVRGGAAYISGGNFTMNGGTIEGNTATESGGAIQISDGNVYITDGSILNNVARGEASDAGYGGGIFVDGGEEVSITGGEISNNVAAKNGGGIEIKTDKVVIVDINSGKFIDNVADEYGGAVGIECDNGTINVGKEGCDGSEVSSHEHPLLSGNMAGIQGGGFYMSGAKAILNIYCGLIDNNIVVDIENNFDQSNGTVTVYEGVQIGEGNEGIIVVGGTFVDKREENVEKATIIYYSNYENSSDYKQALVTKGSLITLPGNIFGVEGYSVIGWTTDPNNTTEIEYAAGEVIEIVDNITIYAMWVLEEENSPSYVIVIPAEILFEKYTSTIEVPVEATLNLFPRNNVLNIRIKEDEFKLGLYSNEEKCDESSYQILKNNEELQDGDIVLSAYSDSALITYEISENIEIIIGTINTQYAGDYQDTLTFVASVEEL